MENEKLAEFFIEAIGILKGIKQHNIEENKMIDDFLERLSDSAKDKKEDKKEEPKKAKQEPKESSGSESSSLRAGGGLLNPSISSGMSTLGGAATKGAGMPGLMGMIQKLQEEKDKESSSTKTLGSTVPYSELAKAAKILGAVKEDKSEEEYPEAIEVEYAESSSSPATPGGSIKIISKRIKKNKEEDNPVVTIGEGMPFEKVISAPTVEHATGTGGTSWCAACQEYHSG